MTPTAYAIIEKYGLEPHPEGGFYRETYRSEHLIEIGDGRLRNLATAIYFLIPNGLTTAWHRVSSDEMWHFYQGDALELELRDESGKVQQIVMGNDMHSAQHNQVLVPSGVWQRARSTGAFSLVGYTVNPGFEFDDFEIEKGS